MIERAEPVPADASPSLAVRLERFRNYLKPIYRHQRDSYDLQGMADLELAVQILNLREFAEWLKVHGDPQQQRFGDEIAEMEFEVASISTALGGERPPHMTKAVEDLVAIEAQRDRVFQAVADATGDEFEDSETGTLDAIKTLAGEAAEAERLRAVLVETGALDAADVETDTAVLLRALLS